MATFFFLRDGRKKRRYKYMKAKWMPSVSYSVTQLGSTSYMALPKRYSAFLFPILKAKIEQKKLKLKVI